MTLKELKKIIAEEYTAYKRIIKEQEDMIAPPGLDNDLPEPTVNVSDADVDLEGGEDAEATLKDIFDMLKDFFEGEDDKGGDSDAGGDKKDDKPKGDAKDDDKKDELKEARNTRNRFRKLANIIKG
tara:strand:+ start:131 stop:508 length:378 start_codon:yes stop_codon:yes gene_type:complete